MSDELFKLRQYILDAPASNDKHQLALNWLNTILEQYKQRIEQLQKQVEKKDGK